MTEAINTARRAASWAEASAGSAAWLFGDHYAEGARDEMCLFRVKDWAARAEYWAARAEYWATRGATLEP